MQQIRQPKSASTLNQNLNEIKSKTEWFTATQHFHKIKYWRVKELALKASLSSVFSFSKVPYLDELMHCSSFQTKPQWDDYLTLNLSTPGFHTQCSNTNLVIENYCLLEGRTSFAWKYVSDPNAIYGFPAASADPVPSLHQTDHRLDSWDVILIRMT